MKKLKKMVALVLAALLCAGCLAGCGDAPNASAQEQDGVGVESQSVTDPVEQEQTTETPTEPAGDTETVWVRSKELDVRKNGNLEAYYEYDFDERGLRTGGRKYRADGELLGELDYYTYTIEDNVVTRYIVDIDDGTISNYVYHFTFDEDGCLRRVCMDDTGRGLQLDDLVPNYDENGKLISIDQYVNFINAEHQDTPYATEVLEWDEDNRTCLYDGYEQLTMDENGRLIQHMAIDTETGECWRAGYICFEYTAIEVPAEYAAMSRAMQDYYFLLYSSV